VKVLRREEELPARLLTSRLVRAVQTAEIVALATEGVKLETVHELAPAGDAVALVARLAHEGATTAMVVGHEPDLSSLVEALLDAPMPTPMDKAMVVALELVSGDSASLRFIVEPRSLALVHDHRVR
jgi:phosphohistidine phosphatase SixA